MTITQGDTLPDATLITMGPDGPEEVALSDKTKGRKVAIFAVPGAFTPTCHSAHMPSFIRTMDQFKAKGVDEVICIAVNDPFVIKAWDEATGASAAGITLLCDPQAEYTKAIGMQFSVPPIGLIGRSMRYAMLVEDNTVSVLLIEEGRGVCETSGGESLLDAM